MEENSRIKKILKNDKNRLNSEEHSKLDIEEDSSNFSDHSDKKNDEEGPKLEIIEEETKNYVEEMKKGSYNILVIKN